MFFLIGIDDTDSASSEGTGRHACRLGELIEERRHGRLVSITRHQLLRHPDIYFTTTNSAACLLVDAVKEARRDLELTCREFLRRFSAPASDPGFALAAWPDLTPEVVTWGRQAKHLMHFRSGAIELAKMNNISCAGFHGTGVGVIGALAAIGLYYSGNDGRFIWLPGLDKLKGTLTLPLMSVGGRGIISVVANIVPKDVSSMTHAFLNGDWKQARELHLKLFSLSQAMFYETNPIPVKAAMAMKGHGKEVYRLPMCPMSDENRKALQAVLEQLKI